jgi:prepilin-type processing-associated H-X9-DG protein
MPSVTTSTVYGPRSYVLTERLGSNGFLFRGPIPLNPPQTSRSFLLVEALVPSATILLTEIWTLSTGADGANIQGNYAKSLATGYTAQNTIPTHPDRSKTYYHGSSINYLMADGRLQSLSPKVLLNYSLPTDPGWAVLR